MIALVSAGAVALAVGGYAIGAAGHRGVTKRPAMCEQAEQEFASRAGQLRKQMQQRGLEVNARDNTLDEAQSKILAEIVQQNPTCFGAGRRATAAVIQQHPSEGEADAVICDLIDIKAEDCSVAVG
ncbi:hypothetical protein DLE60_17320 [Micromonospora globispora]|uniref:Uncharacterized protein n=1 Tax=Micromonospora globispora TaxID=1450148 RepID=A0A317KEW8_9ACTN|nr:hypothetical protein [Micromonospora globispora]PWU52106.1 hypothetical protein DLJ46_03750 [Micromonospora globispora]PWU59281.1 hypothetical protein DLE60_17320 [Micromonospora globispora]RQW92897.1 hypothetical protein DKL51_18240 [Micromonospora globispora]